ncbi:unnamed protein product [[Candida] boidinii]|nr:unnamed protein product [[Candida] boidinii]
MGLSLDPNTTATQDSNNGLTANGTNSTNPKSIFSSHFYNGDNSSPVMVPSTPPPQNQSQMQNGAQKNIDQNSNKTQQQDQKFTSVFSSTQPGTPNWASSSKNDPQQSQQQQSSQSNTTSGSFLPDITMATTPQQSNAQQFLPMGSQNFISLTPNPFNSQMGNNQSTPFSSKIEVPSTAPPVPVGRSSSLGIVGGSSTMRPFVLPESVQVQQQQQQNSANSNSDSGSNSANSSVVLNANNITGVTTLAGDESSPAANSDEKVPGSSSTGSATGKVSSNATNSAVTNSASNSKSDPANKDTTGSFGPLLNNNKDGRSSYSNGSPNQLNQQIGNEFDQSIHSMNQGLAPIFFNNTGSMSMGAAGGVNAPFPVSGFNSFIPNRSQGLQQQLSSASIASANSSNDPSSNGSAPPFAMGYQNGGVIPGLESAGGVADSFNGLGGANSFGQLPNANSLLQGNAMYNQQLPPLGATFNPVTGNQMSDYYAAQQMQHAMNLGNPQHNLLSQQDHQQQDPQQQQQQHQQQQQQAQGQQAQGQQQHFNQMLPHGLQGQQMHIPSMAAAQQLQQQHLARDLSMHL